MADRRKHRQVGAIFGFLFTLSILDDQEATPHSVEMMGGLLGGIFGGMLPDLIEPPSHPGHRSIAHALLPIGGAGIFVVPNLQSCQHLCRREAAQCRLFHRMSRNETERLRWEVEELIWRYAAGVIPGIVAGYLSHLLLDAATPRGLPLLK